MADGANERNRMSTLDIPLIIRGQVIETDMQRFEGRGGGVDFRAPDLMKHLAKLPTSAQSLGDLYRISLDEIIDFMAEVGARLDLDTNLHLQAAFELSSHTSGMTASILETQYRNFAKTFTRETIANFVSSWSVRYC